MARFCLIGKKLGHSLSPDIHTRFGYDYDLVELQENEIADFIKSGDYDGFNVTIPYKKVVFDYLDEVDDKARSIGAVNTVVKKDGKLYGYNTDILGMEYAFLRSGIDLSDKAVMILGTGGTSLTAEYLAKKSGAKSIVKVSRTGEVNYSNYTEYSDTQVIVNTTPVGMYPNVDESLVNIDDFPSLSAGFDPIYNPLKTDFVSAMESKNIPCSNGLMMLVAQAKYARDLFLGDTLSDGVIDEIYRDLSKKLQNIVLIGMPGCGKSTIGKLLSEKLGKTFVDIDKEIENRTNLTIPDIFERYGEEYFRNLESEVIKDIATRQNTVISLGGGAVKRESNIKAVKRQGIVVYVERDISLLDKSGRPLSNSTGVEKLFEERKPLYKGYADKKVQNKGELSDVVHTLVEVI